MATASVATAPDATGPDATAPDATAPVTEQAIADLAGIFGLLGDPGRLRLLTAMLHGERRVGDLAAAARLSESAASHALRILRAHRVVSVRRQGRMAFYELADEHVRSLLAVALTHVAHGRDTDRHDPAGRRLRDAGAAGAT